MSQPNAAPLAPMTPHAAISAFHYLRAVQAGDAAAGAFAAAEPQLAAMLVDAATRIVVPVTALSPNTGEACEDAFALEALGRVFLTALRTWEQAGPDAAEGIARAVIAFTEQILTEDHENVANILRQLEAVGVGQALEAHPAPGCAHPVHRTAV